MQFTLQAILWVFISFYHITTFIIDRLANNIVAHVLFSVQNFIDSSHFLDVISPIMIKTMGMQHFLSVGNITNFRHLTVAKHC